MMNSTCPSDDLLSDFLLGRLSDAESLRIEAHFADCPHCLEQAEAISCEDTLTISLADTSTQPAQEPSISADEFEHDAAETLYVAGAARSSDELSFLSPPQADDEIGRLNGYRILDVIGRGGMGIVFLAEDLRLQRQVALKVIRPEFASESETRERFLREAKSAAAIQHDQIVTIHQVGEESGVLFLAMQVLAGESLQSRIQETERLDPKEVIRISMQIADGLAAAHQQGLTHRDIKPDNIWLEAPKDRVKILDFGLARAVDDDSQLTLSGMIVGTPRYLAPEQAEGRPVDQRADLFSLGVVMYHMLTGESPFARPTLLATLNAIGSYSPEPPHHLRSDIPPELSQLVMDSLEKTPEQRVGSVDEVLQRLAALAVEIDRDALPLIESRRTTESLSNETQEQPVHVQASGSSHGSMFKRVLLGATACVLFASALVLTFRTPDGEWNLEVYDEDVSVLVRQDGETVDQLTVQAGKAGKIELSVGHYDVEIQGIDGDIVLADGKVEVQRDGKIIARLTSHNEGALREANIADAKFPDKSGKARQTDEQTTTALSRKATVQNPASLPGVTGWSIEPVATMGELAVAISPNGELAASFCDDGIIRVWDTTAHPRKSVLKHMLVGHRTGIFSQSSGFEFCPDNRHLASVDHSGELRVWDAEQGKLVFVHREGDSQVKQINWSPDGKQLAVSHDDKKVRILDLTGKKTATLRHLYGVTHALVWSPDSTRLATVDDGAQLFNWNIASSKARVFKVPPGLLVSNMPQSIVWKPDGSQLAATAVRGGKNYALLVWDVDRNSMEVRIDQFRESRALCYSADGKTLFVGNDPMKESFMEVVELDTKTYTESRRYQFQMYERVTRLDLFSDGNHLLASNPGSHANRIHLPSGESESFHNPTFTHASTTGETMVGRAMSGSSESRILVNCLAKPSEQRFNAANSVRRIRATLSPSGNLVAVNQHAPNSTTGIQVFDLRTGLRAYQCDYPPYVDGGPAVFSPDELWLLTVRNGVQVQAHNLQEKSEPVQIDTLHNGRRLEAYDAAWSPDSELIAIMASTHVMVYNRAGKLVRSWPVKVGEELAGGSSIAWSPDGESIAVGLLYTGIDYETPVMVYHAESGELKNRYQWQKSGHIYQIGWSADGRFLAGRSPSNTVITFDCKTGRVVLSAEKVKGFSFCDNQALLVTNTDGGTKRIDLTSMVTIGESNAGLGAYGVTFSRNGSRMMEQDKGRLRIWETESGKLMTTIFPCLSLHKTTDSAFIGPEGHMNVSSPDAFKELRYVVRTDAGQKLYTPFEFYNKFDWENDNKQAIVGDSGPFED